MQHFHTPDGRWVLKMPVQSEPFCATRVNATAATWQQHDEHRALLDYAKTYRVHPIPYVSLDSVDVNSGHLFPWGTPQEGNKFALDCTHRTYTPLYFDAVFATFTSVLCGF